MAETVRFTTLRHILGMNLRHKEMKIVWLDILNRLQIQERTPEAEKFAYLVNSYAATLEMYESVDYTRFIHEVVLWSLPAFCEEI